MFRRAERKRARLRAALCGPSGSGKTYSALRLARGLVGPEGRIGLIDTERGRGELYSANFVYDVAPMVPPYTPKRYVEYIDEAGAEGYDCLIIDSLSHAWSGVGGVLEMVDNAAAASNSRNTFQAWGKVSPEHNRMVDALMQSPAHIIACMRTKTAWEVQDNDKGKKAPVKVGLKPEQREGIEYEFMVVLDIAVESHYTTTWKDNTQVFGDEHVVIAEAHGQALRAWLDDGADPVETLRRDYLPLLERAEDLSMLRATWQEVYTQAQHLNRPDMLEQLAQVKDRRKADLEALDGAEPPTDDPPPPDHPTNGAHAQGGD